MRLSFYVGEMKNALVIPLIEDSVSLNVEARDNERSVPVVSEMRNRHLQTTNDRKLRWVCL